MTEFQGIKVSLPGFDARTAQPYQLAFSSEYQTLKVQQQGSGSILDSTGRTVTIPHNLGYVPRFIVHTTGNPVSDPAGGFFHSPYISDLSSVTTWADNTNLYIKASDWYGYRRYSTYEETNNYGSKSFGNYFAGFVAFGHTDTFTGSDISGALRFEDIDIVKLTDIYKASCSVYIETRPGSSNVSVTIWGIDENNTADFGGDPFGRPKTSASGSETASGSLQEGDTWTFGVTNQAQEIIDRSDWTSGSALGFIIENNGTTGENRIEDIRSGDGGGNSYTTFNVLLSDTILSYKYTIFLDRIE